MENAFTLSMDAKSVALVVLGLFGSSCLLLLCFTAARCVVAMGLNITFEEIDDGGLCKFFTILTVFSFVASCAYVFAHFEGWIS